MNPMTNRPGWRPRRDATPFDQPRTREPRPDDLEVLELSEFLSLPLRAAQRVYAAVEA